MITDEVSSGRSILGSLRNVYGEVSESYKCTSLTSIITDGETVCATKCVDSGHNEEYYDLMYAKKNGFVVISQEKTWQLNWEKIPNGRVMIVNPNYETSMERLF